MLLVYYIMFACLFNIEIGPERFDYVESYRIDNSIELVGNTGSITLPRRVRFGTKDITDVIKKGMPVRIQAGYRNDFNSSNLGLTTRFVGYVDRIGTKVPFTITLIDEMFTLREADPVNLDYPNGIKLSTLIKSIAPGYTYIIDETITLGPLRVEEQSPQQVIMSLLSQGIYCRFLPPTDLYFKNRAYTPVLKCGLAYTNWYRRVKFSFRENVINDSTEYTQADRQKICIKAISNQKDGNKLVYYYPPALKNKAETHTLNKYNVSLASLKRMAEDQHRKFTREGYTGTLRTFGVPLIAPGDVSVIDNQDYPAKNGDYIIDAVTEEGGIAGIKQTVRLGGVAGSTKRA